MVNQRVKGITFDCWDTVMVDSLENWVEERIWWMQEILKGMGHSISSWRIKEAFDREPQAFDSYTYQYGVTPDARWRTAMVLQELNISLPPEDIEKLSTHYENLPLKSLPPLVTGIIEALKVFSSTHGLVMICNTGWYPGRVVRAVLTKHGVREYFQHLFFSNEVGIAKPDPRIFHFALGLLNLGPREVVHIGDSETLDVAGAQKAGMRAILFRGVRKKGEDKTRADAVLNRWEDLSATISRLEHGK